MDRRPRSWLPARKRPQVVVLGCGPAGLFAAVAAEGLGANVQIISKARKSQLFGAQYLHAPIPGLDSGEPEVISYRLTGTVEQYRAKVYGQNSQLTVSPEALNSDHKAWNIRTAYDAAWDRFSDRIQDREITSRWLHASGATLSADFVIWSIPSDQFCIGGHTFAAQNVYAKGDAPELNEWCPVMVAPWTVQCNGEESPRWYRASNIFGHKSAEWPDGPAPPIKGLARVTKPIFTNCSCWHHIGRAPVLRVGRYGRWEKGELTHQAYERTIEWLR